MGQSMCCNTSHANRTGLPSQVIVCCPSTTGRVTFPFRWKDYAYGNRQKAMALSGDEFLRRFLIHVLPRGFVRIRFFGFLSRRTRARLLPICRVLAGALPQDRTASAPVVSRLFVCPCCGGTMMTIQTCRGVGPA